MTDHRERARLAIEQLTALRKAYTPDQGGADVVYGDALYDLANYPWDEAILRIRSMARHSLHDTSFAAYLKVRAIVAPHGYLPLEPVSDEDVEQARVAALRIKAAWEDACRTESSLRWRLRIFEGEARLAAREAAMKEEGK